MANHVINISLDIDGEYINSVELFYNDDDGSLKDMVADACDQAMYHFITYDLPTEEANDGIPTA